MPSAAPSAMPPCGNAPAQYPEEPSQWPPLIPKEIPAATMRGPGTQPVSIALRSAMSAKPAAPTLRTVVKPASRVCCACAAPCSACSAGLCVILVCC